MDNKVMNRGELDLAGIKIPCYVLEDGIRVLSGRKMQEALKMVDYNGQNIPKYIKQKPSFIGKLTRKYIYEELPKGVVDKIREKVGKTEKGNWKYKWHQTLTPEIGREHLKKQIIEVTTLMSVSKSKEQFEALFQQKYNKIVQLELEFNEDVTIAPPSQFDKKLIKALNYNPHNDDKNDNN